MLLLLLLLSWSRLFQPHDLLSVANLRKQLVAIDKIEINYKNVEFIKGLALFFFSLINYQVFPALYIGRDYVFAFEIL